MIQGIEYHNNHFYITADDGAAEKGQSDHTYRVDFSGQVSLFLTLTELNDVGEIEGLSIDEQNQKLLVHSNRGKRIVLGMPKGFILDMTVRFTKSTDFHYLNKESERYNVLTGPSSFQQYNDRLTASKLPL